MKNLVTASFLLMSFASMAEEELPSYGKRIANDGQIGRAIKDAVEASGQKLCNYVIDGKKGSFDISEGPDSPFSYLEFYESDDKHTMVGVSLGFGGKKAYYHIVTDDTDTKIVDIRYKYYYVDNKMVNKGSIRKPQYAMLKKTGTLRGEGSCFDRQ